MNPPQQSRLLLINDTDDLLGPCQPQALDGAGHVRSKLRRVVSMRAFAQNIDSSESIPSEHSSLYDAALASIESESEDKLPEQTNIAQLERTHTDLPGGIGEEFPFSS